MKLQTNERRNPIRARAREGSTWAGISSLAALVAIFKPEWAPAAEVLGANLPALVSAAAAVAAVALPDRGGD